MTLPVSVQVAWPAVFVAAVPLLVWLMARSRQRLVRRHLLVAAVLRGLALVALSLALMRPLWHAESDGVSVVYALDVSHSVSAGFIDAAIGWIETAQREARPTHARYVAFADHAILLRQPQDLLSVAVGEPPPTGVSLRPEVIDRNETNLERALDTALLGLDGEQAKRIVLLTDGNQTAGDVWRMLPRLTRAQVRVFPIVARMHDGRDAAIARIDMPSIVTAAEPFNVTVRVVSAYETKAEVKLSSEQALLGKRTLQLRTGPNSVVFEAAFTQGGTRTLTAEVFAEGDQTARNNRLQRSVWVRARPSVLYVEGGRPDSARYLADALRTQGLVTRVATPDALPDTAQELARYDGLILSDTPANALGAEQMKAIGRYVRDFGGGLLFASGENVHGEHGYNDTLLEQVLPVQFRAQDKRKDLALVVALDRSYSMKGRKMDMAKEAARAALDLLEEQHRFGVVAFDSQPYVAVPVEYVRSRRKAQDQISRIQASGQTNIYPALGVTYRLLQKTDAKAKHVILLSDGDTHPADFESLVKRMAAEHIVVSTVAVGADADRALMSDIARWGKGRAYVAESAEAIPQLFIEETERAVGSNLQEHDFKPVLKSRTAALRDLRMDALPDLKGYVSSKARDNAEVLLSTPTGAPLLVRWQYGLGRVVAYTSDVKSRWAANWLAWPGYGKFWSQQMRDLLRRDSGEELDFNVVREGREALITLSTLTPAGNFREGLAPQVRITRPDGSNSVVLLEQTGPGAYGLRLPADDYAPSAYFELLESPGLPRSAIARAGARVFHRDFPDEFQVMTPDTALLGALARATGGKIAPAIAEIFERRGDTSGTARDLWPWLALLGLVCYLLDIAVRRAPLAWRWLATPPRAV